MFFHLVFLKSRSQLQQTFLPLACSAILNHFLPHRRRLFLLTIAVLAFTSYHIPYLLVPSSLKYLNASLNPYMCPLSKVRFSRFPVLSIFKLMVFLTFISIAYVLYISQNSTIFGKHHHINWKSDALYFSPTNPRSSTSTLLSRFITFDY